MLFIQFVALFLLLHVINPNKAGTVNVIKKLGWKSVTILHTGSLSSLQCYNHISELSKAGVLSRCSLYDENYSKNYFHHVFQYSQDADFIQLSTLLQQSEIYTVLLSTAPANLPGEIFFKSLCLNS